MNKKKINNEFKVKEVFNPNAKNIEEKMKEVFVIYLNEKLIDIRK